MIYFPEKNTAWAQNVPVQHGHGFCLKMSSTRYWYVTFINRAPHIHESPSLARSRPNKGEFKGGTHGYGLMTTNRCSAMRT